MTIAALALVAAVIGGPAPNCPGGTVELSWAQKPNEDQIWWAYPSAAVNVRASGKVVLTCGVTTAGATKDCQVVSEDPAGLGFGGAAVALSAQFLFTPRTVCGQPVESSARIPINFRPPEGLPPVAGPPPSARAIALSRRLLTAMHLDEALDSTISDWVNQDVNDEGASAEVRKARFDTLTAVFDHHRQAFEDAIVATYARELSEAELAKAAAFFETPVGQKLGEKDLRLAEVIAGAIEENRLQLQREAAGPHCSALQSCPGASETPSP